MKVSAHITITINNLSLVQRKRLFKQFIKTLNNVSNVNLMDHKLEFDITDLVAGITNSFSTHWLQPEGRFITEYSDGSGSCFNLYDPAMEKYLRECGKKLIRSLGKHHVY